MKRIILSLVLLLGSAQGLWAQWTSYLRVEGGTALIEIRAMNSPMKYDGSMSWHLGANLEISPQPLGYRRYYISPGLYYKYRSISVDNAKPFERQGMGSLSLSHLELPLNLGFRTYFDSGLSLALEAGPYVAYLLSASMDVPFESVARVTGMNTLDFGLNAAVLLEYDSFYARVGYSYGLQNVYKPRLEGETTRHTAFTCSVGYRF